MTGIQFATTAGPLYTETRSYNNLLQLTNITAAGSGLPGMNLTYTYNIGHNNGQAAGITDALSGEQITYTYDLLNRLIQASIRLPGRQYRIMQSRTGMFTSAAD